MVNPFSVTSSGRQTVLVDDAAEAIAALHSSVWQRDHVSRLVGPALLDPLVRAGVVVVIDKLHQHALSRCQRPKINIRGCVLYGTAVVISPSGTNKPSR